MEVKRLYFLLRKISSLHNISSPWSLLQDNHLAITFQKMKRNYSAYLLAGLCWLSSHVYAQKDTLKIVNLEEVKIQNSRTQNPITALPDTHNLMVIGGRKTESITVSGMAA